MKIIKVCKDCKKSKPISFFYKHNQTKDGYLNKCKECVKSRVAQHRLNNLEKIRAYDRARGNRQTASYRHNYIENYPNKYKAHTMVNNALRDGKLEKLSNCEKCNSTNSIVGHHDDYLKPLSVTWLCQACHKQWHANNGEGRNGK